MLDFQFTAGRMVPVKVSALVFSFWSPCRDHGLPQEGIIGCQEHAEVLQQAWVEAQHHAVETEVRLVFCRVLQP